MRKPVVVVFFDETGQHVPIPRGKQRRYPRSRRSGVVIGDIYISKAAIAGKRPERIKLTIEY